MLEQFPVRHRYVQFFFWYEDFYAKDKILNQVSAKLTNAAIDYLNNSSSGADAHLKKLLRSVTKVLSVFYLNIFEVISQYDEEGDRNVWMGRVSLNYTLVQRHSSSYAGTQHSITKQV